MALDEHWDPNMLVVCPYDEMHRIAACRFQKHILKCRKNHPSKDTVACPYNASHILLRPNLCMHLGKCPDRTAIDPDVFQAQCEETGEIQRLMGNVSIPERRWQSPDDHEDWDIEAEQYEHEKFTQNCGQNQDYRKQNIRRSDTYSNTPSRFSQHRENSPVTENSMQVQKLRHPRENKDLPKTNNHSSTGGSSSSLYVRLAGRGQRPKDSTLKSANDPCPPGKLNAPSRVSSCFGRGRGTILFKSPTN